MKEKNEIIQNNARVFVDHVAEFADSVMQRCRDRCSSKETSLLMDGIDLKTGEPMKREGYALSNLACQQILLRTLDGLAALTGETRYQEQSREWINYALEVLPNPESGMLYWGGQPPWKGRALIYLRSIRVLPVLIPK